NRFAESLNQRFFARLNKDHARGQHQHPQLHEQNDRQLLAHDLEKPGLGNLETKLIIERLRRSRNQSLRLRQQSTQPRIIDRTSNLALESRAIDFENERDQRFQRQQSEQYHQRPRDIKIRRRKFNLFTEQRQSCQHRQIRTEQDEIRCRSQQPIALQ